MQSQGARTVHRRGLTLQEHRTFSLVSTWWGRDQPLQGVARVLSQLMRRAGEVSTNLKTHPKGKGREAEAHREGPGEARWEAAETGS